MKFWDSSAIVPLLVPEVESKIIRGLLENDPEMLVWMLTPSEILSAVYRKAREGKILEKDLILIRLRLSDLEKGWSEIVSWENVRQKANRLLAVHPLRAADAIQLAAALTAFEDHPEGEEFVTFDHNLSNAARREGFHVVPA